MFRQWGWFGREETASDKNFSNDFSVVLWSNPQVEPFKKIRSCHCRFSVSLLALATCKPCPAGEVGWRETPR